MWGHIACKHPREFRRDVFAGAAGRNWSDYHYSRGEQYYQEHFQNALGFCERILAQNATSRFMQVGCAGGRELAILAASFPRVRFCGVDLNREAIRENEERYHSLTNLEFRIADITLPEQWTNWQPHIIYSSHCLTYLTRDEVFEFFRASQKAGVCELLLFEPTNRANQGISIPLRGSATFAHDYADLL